MISGGQCVMTAGTVWMPVWSASSWDMHTLEVSASILALMLVKVAFSVLQVELHIGMLFLVLVLDPSTWMMLLVL